MSVYLSGIKFRAFDPNLTGAIELGVGNPFWMVWEESEKEEENDERSSTRDTL